MKQQVARKTVRSVFANTMAGCNDLSDFECVLYIGARKLGRRVSEVGMKYGFFFSTLPLQYFNLNIENLKKEKKNL